MPGSSRSYGHRTYALRRPTIYWHAQSSFIRPASCDHERERGEKQGRLEPNSIRRHMQPGRSVRVIPKRFLIFLGAFVSLYFKEIGIH
jgi:hypothetical protein